MTGRIMAVDPGEKRIGIAISDLSGSIANPLTVIKHVSMSIDCAMIASIAYENQVGSIIIGQAFSEGDEETRQMRHASKIQRELQSQTDLPVYLWDESHSTKTARQARVLMGVKRQKRSGHLDALAAVVILQSFLDWQADHGSDHDKSS
jgi:putative Holliday junction resolvase